MGGPGRLAARRGRGEPAGGEAARRHHRRRAGDDAVTGVGAVRAPARGWSRVAATVARHPRRIWIGTALVLAAGSFGLLCLQVGLGPEDTFTRRVDSVAGQELINAHYPDGQAGPADILVRADRADAVPEVARRAPGVAAVGPAQTSADGQWVRLSAVLTDAPSSPAAEVAVARLRAAVHAVPAAQALVGGQTAIALDTKAAADRDNLVVVPQILAVVLAVLIPLLRALVAPLLLVASVVLSYAATMASCTPWPSPAASSPAPGSSWRPRSRCSPRSRWRSPCTWDWSCRSASSSTPSSSGPCWYRRWPYT